MEDTVQDVELEMFERTANSRRALKNQEQTKVWSVCYMLFDDHPEPMSVDYE